MDPSSVREVTEMRAALEALALRHALPLIDANAIATADAALRQIDGATEILDLERVNRRFHRAILDPCGMPRLLMAIRDLEIEDVVHRPHRRHRLRRIDAGDNAAHRFGELRRVPPRAHDEILGHSPRLWRLRGGEIDSGLHRRLVAALPDIAHDTDDGMEWIL